MSAISILTAGLVGAAPGYLLPTNPPLFYGTIHLTAGAQGPDLAYQLRDALGMAIPVPANATVKLTLWRASKTSPTVDAAGYVANAANGIVGFSWQEANVVIPAAGQYSMQWHINEATYPFGDRIPVTIIKGY